MAQQSIVGEKVGMTQTWVDDKVVPVTVLRVEPMRIVQIKTNERNGYTALQVTYGHKDAKKLNRPDAGQFSKAGVAPGKRLIELRLDSVDGFDRRPGDHGRSDPRRLARRRHRAPAGARASPAS